MTWYEYVRQMAGDDSNETIAQRIGSTGATVGRWKGRYPNPKDVVAFARAYERPVVEAFLEAGWFSAEEAGVQIAGTDPRLLSNDELVAEIARRLQASIDGSSPEDISTSDRLKRRQREQREQRSKDPHT